MGRKILASSLRDSQLAHPNFGTVIWFEKNSGLFNTTIKNWQIQHPKFKVFIAYGVTAYWSDTSNQVSALSHGNALAIKSPNNICRYYPYPKICLDYDRLLMPLQAIFDWDENKQSKCLHIDDLYWFYPDYRNPVSAYKQMGKVELISAIVRRVELARSNALLFDAKPVKSKLPTKASAKALTKAPTKTPTKPLIRNPINVAKGQKGWGPSDPTWWTYQPPY
ncbi:MAG: hypothetical protein KME64_35970 [Scytonematopsis contorta HA4267-MV1]|jgi:hypothetical protein|nr:hypothetical protein [Scytonematopsis contorta HA4267-MV1]